MKQTERNTETKNALFAVIVLTIGMIAFLVPMVFQLGIVIECVSYWRDNSQIDEFDYEYKKIPPMARTMTDQE